MSLLISRKKTGTLATPTSATTTVIGYVKGLSRFNWFQIAALITAHASGTVDIYLQRQLEPDVWQDWLHFPQVAAAATKRYAVSSQPSSSIVEVGGGSDASPGLALAANTMVGGHPGDVVRVVAVGGAGTSAAGSVAIWVDCFEDG